jgi:hypothetical protein
MKLLRAMWTILTERAPAAESTQSLQHGGGSQR